MIIPLLLTISLGAVETATVLFDIHRLNEAARQIARTAIIERPVPKISDLQAGAVVCTGLGTTGIACENASIENPKSFENMLDAGKKSFPTLKAENIRIIYEDSGTVRMATNQIVTPAVTVELRGIEFQSFFLSKVMPETASEWILPSMISARVGAAEVL